MKVVCCRQDEKLFKEDLMNIAKTSISSKILTQFKEKFATLAVDAVLRLKVGPFRSFCAEHCASCNDGLYRVAATWKPYKL